MRSVPLAMIAAVMMAAIALVPVISDESDAAGTDITGTVKEGTSPLAGVIVSVTLGSTVMSATTANDGTFTIAEFPATTGNATVTFEIEGKMVDTGSLPASLTDARTGGFTLNLASSAGVIGDVLMMNASLSGYLMMQGTGENEPLTNVPVTISNSLMKNVKTTGTTDSEGKFVIPIMTTCDLSLMIDLEGYYPSNGLFFMTFNDSGAVTFSLSGSAPDLGIASYSIPYVDSAGGRVYELSDDYPIIMSTATGTVTGIVKDSDGQALQRAEVTLTSVNTPSLSFTATTDDAGKFSIDSVVTGEYKMTVEVPGFKDYTADGISIIKGQNPELSATMTSVSPQDFFGMSPSHFMMILGVFIGIILMIASYLIYSGHVRPKLEDEE